MKRASLDRSSPLPLHSQIKQILIAELKDSAKVADLVLTEVSLMERFKVSRAPVRQALKDLEDEGYVVRHRAKGTFPVRRVDVRLPPVLELGGLSRYLSEQGLKPTSRIVDVARLEAPVEVKQALNLGRSAQLLRIQRIIFVTGTPLAWVSTYLDTPPDFVPEIEELERIGTVFDLIEQSMGVVFTRGEQNIWAAGASKEEAEALGVTKGSPVLVAVTTMFASNGQVCGWRRAVHRAEDFKYTFGLSS